MKNKQRKWYLMLTIILIMTSMLAGCSSKSSNADRVEGEKKDEIVISVGAESEDGYDPCTGAGINLFFSGLLGFDKECNLTKDLASDYSVSQDGLTYTFILRDDVKFSDGTPVTAQDVVFTYNTTKESGSTVDLSFMKSVEAKDAKTIVFTLEKPYSVFLNVVAERGIVPEHAYGSEYSQKPIGSGPFILTQWDKGQQMILESNPYYYGTRSSFKKVTILFLDEDAVLAAVQSGQLDIAMINPQFSEQVPEGMKLVAIDTVDNRGINLPTIPESTDPEGKLIGNNVTSDLAIRKALNIGIDRQQIIDDALNGYGTPAYSVCDTQPWWNPETAVMDGRIEEACEILEEAGWIDTDGDGIREKNGMKAEFTVYGRTDDLQRYTLAVSLSNQAKALGINIKAEAIGWTEAKAQSMSTPTVFGFGSYSPIQIYFSFHSKNIGVGINNTASYHNPKVDEYIEKALYATNEEESMKYWKLAQWDGTTGLGANGDAPWLWIVNIQHLYLMNDHLDIGIQRVHPHGHGWPIVQNINEWAWRE
ncbi:peptide/nickel transport system substrate-binding protein [Anaerosolibacter carboniphilus]|uniref:Peptide/nickel transport system substrate-binding protein n=1 Tax=Anaerosolibacter carboniphilus TaxID=1417629 RepID=A0A841KYY9_9FIRM|nr:ABC transporter substrate-binding protein [Anaerosolibacter carboniphilus]MBB6216122.1 peptide/nickel transport system substrate-binding protein [Anaerosolibacter carboniphilus]